MAAQPSPSITAPYTECWVFRTMDGVPTSIPAEAIATGAQCYEVFPTGGGVERSSIPNSEAWPMETEPAAPTPSPDGGSNERSMVGPIVGSVVGILVIAVPLLYLLARREARRRRRAAQKHQWAMTPGKWVTDERKLQQYPYPPSQAHAQLAGSGRNVGLGAGVRLNGLGLEGISSSRPPTVTEVGGDMDVKKEELTDVSLGEKKDERV